VDILSSTVVIPFNYQNKNNLNIPNGLSYMQWLTAVAKLFITLGA
jgi:hypothetical protein